MTEPQMWDIEDMTLPTQERVKKRVWILSEDPAQIEARVRTQVAVETLRAVADKIEADYPTSVWPEDSQHPEARVAAGIRHACFRMRHIANELEVAAEPTGTPKQTRHASPGCACGVNDAGQRYIDPICRSK